jgi:hypothetical protein
MLLPSIYPTLALLRNPGKRLFDDSIVNGGRSNRYEVKH